MTIPKPSATIRRTVIVQLPRNDNPNGVWVPDDDILFDELSDLPGFELVEGPYINGALAVHLERSEHQEMSNADMATMTIEAVHAALIRTHKEPT